MTESQLNQINNELAQLVQVPHHDAHEQGQLVQVSDPNQDIYAKEIASSDLLFLRNTQEWPTFSDNETRFLCLNNKTRKLHGFIVEGSFAVNHGYIFNGGNGNATIYESYEQILKDGWTVD